MTFRAQPIRMRIRVGAALLATIVALATSIDGWAQSATQSSRLVYVPPDLGAPPTRTLAAARGAGEQPLLQVLAPEQTGLSLSAQPKLLWYLSAPSALPIQVTIIDDAAIEPLLEVDLGSIDRPGFHVTDLRDYGVRLEPETYYQWSVAQVVDSEHRSADIVASATIAWRPEPTPVMDVGKARLRQLETLASQGYWYDLIAKLSQEIAARPNDATLWAQRADLLDQVGLYAVARFDRAAAVQ
jgi:Domain of Unknown Function (DUF928)